MRGRNRNKGPNPLTRSYESNGPDVKIRGTAQHVADKYSQLSRDAHASGDPVAAENYLQHAEHYYRLIAAAQEQYRQQFGGLQRDEEGDEGDEEGGFGGGPADRGQGGDEFGDAPNFPQGGYDRQARFDRGDRQTANAGRQRFDRNGERYDRGPQNGGERYDRNQGGERYDRNAQQGGQERGQERSPERGERFDRPSGYDRPNGGERHDRNNGYDRQDRPERQDRADRQDRRERFGRDDRPREERGGRESFAPRESRPAGYEAGQQGDDEGAAGGGNLPAFLTTPVRPAISVDEVAENAGLNPPHASVEEPGATGIRPRRRRPRKADPASEGVDETADGG